MRYRRLILVAVYAVAAAYAASAQTGNATQPAAAPQETVRQFYAWYLHRLNKEDYNPLDRKSVV